MVKAWRLNLHEISENVAVALFAFTAVAALYADAEAAARLSVEAQVVDITSVQASVTSCQDPIVNVFEHERSDCTNRNGRSPFSYNLKFAPISAAIATAYEGACKDIIINSEVARWLVYTGDGANGAHCSLRLYPKKGCHGSPEGYPASVGL